MRFSYAIKKYLFFPNFYCWKNEQKQEDISRWEVKNCYIAQKGVAYSKPVHWQDVCCCTVDSSESNAVLFFVFQLCNRGDPLQMNVFLLCERCKSRFSGWFVGFESRIIIQTTFYGRCTDIGYVPVSSKADQILYLEHVCERTTILLII